MIRVFIICLFLSAFAYPATKIQGTYEDGKNPEKPFHILQVHYTDANHILFYLEAGQGAPSYNGGSLYGRLTLNSKTGHYEYLPKDITEGCKLDFSWNANKVTVKTVAGDCGFGNGVDADDIYTLTNKTNPQYFISRHGPKVFFDKTAPEAGNDY